MKSFTDEAAKLKEEAEKKATEAEAAGYFPIWYDENMTGSKKDPVNVKIFERQCLNYGESETYSLRINAEDETCSLLPNAKSLNPDKIPDPQEKPPRNGAPYIFVVIWKNNKPQLRIG